MGWIILEHRGQLAHIQDRDLMLLKHFICKLLDSLSPEKLSLDSETHTELCNYIEGWDRVAPGVVMNLEPDIFLDDSSQRREALMKLFNLTAEHVSEFGEAISLRYLQSQIGNPVVHYCAAVPTKSVYETIGAFLKVISLP